MHVVIGKKSGVALVSSICLYKVYEIKLIVERRRRAEVGSGCPPLHLLYYQQVTIGIEVLEWDKKVMFGD